MKKIFVRMTMQFLMLSIIIGYGGISLFSHGMGS